MLRIILLILALFLGIQPAQAKRGGKLPAAADFPKYQNKPIPFGATQWHCHYDGAIHIQCRLATSGIAIQPVAVSARLPGVVDKILNHPDQLAGSVVAIPLHGVPFDMEMVGKLAEAVMCASRAACGIVFGENRAALLAQVAAGEPVMLAGR